MVTQVFFFTEAVANYLFKKNKMFLIIRNSLFKGSKTSKYAEYTRKKLISFDNLMCLELNLNDYEAWY